MSHDTWIHRFSRVTVARPLAGTAVTPNHVTTARLVTGMAAAAAISIGLPLWRDVGAAVFVLSVVLDRADGELARLTGQTSAAGHRYDLIADAVSNAVIFFGLGVGMRDGGFGLWAIPLGVLAGAGVAAILALVMRVEAAKGARAGELPGVAGFDVDDLVLIVPLALWLDQSDLLLAAGAVGAPVFAMVYYLAYRRVLRAPEPD